MGTGGSGGRTKKESDRKHTHSGQTDKKTDRRAHKGKWKGKKRASKTGTVKVKCRVRSKAKNDWGSSTRSWLAILLVPNQACQGRRGGGAIALSLPKLQSGGAGDKDSSLPPSFTHSGSARRTNPEDFSCGGALNFHKFSDNDLLIPPAQAI